MQPKGDHATDATTVIWRSILRTPSFYLAESFMVRKRMSRNLFEKAHTVVRLNVKRTTRKLPSFRSSKKITPSSFSRVSTALICVIGQEEAAQWGEVVLYRAVQKDVGEQKRVQRILHE